MMGLTEGVATRSRWQPDPVLHIVWRVGRDYALWCSGGEAVAGINTMRRRRCAACTRLLAEGVAEGDYDPDDQSAWLRSTRPT